MIFLYFYLIGVVLAYIAIAIMNDIVPDRESAEWPIILLSWISVITAIVLITVYCKFKITFHKPSFKKLFRKK